MMQIGLLKLESNLCLSPLAGYTNLPFRLVVREIGGVGLCTTDLVNARSLLEKRAKAYKLIETRPADSPLAVQLFGSVPEEMRDAALMLAARGVAAIDINMGCPVRKVCNVGGGSAMMTQLNRTATLVRGMAEAVTIPVTAKMRLGWDDQNITAPDLARVLEDAGVAAIFVHGRTREQGFGGVVNLDGIRQVVSAVKAIPVIGNGDITTPQAARKMLDETGCGGVSIGRGAFYNPWIFRHTLDYLQSTRGRTGSSVPAIGLGASDAAQENLPPEPPFTERVRVMCRHLDLMIEVFGEEGGCRMFRKVAPWYARRFGPSHEFNKRAVQISTRAEFQDVLENYIRWRRQFTDDHGELLPRFRPPPLVASFMRDQPASTQRQSIPVPKGPVEVW
ncbi:MAG: tRNA-dihydrouridine synthase [Verrucomicrobiota bacterium]|jgi:nifR3 family TIM-barrel protein